MDDPFLDAMLHSNLEVSVEDVIPDEFFLLILNLFTRDTENFYPKCFKIFNDAKDMQRF